MNAFLRSALHFPAAEVSPAGSSWPQIAFSLGFPGLGLSPRFAVLFHQPGVAIAGVRPVAAPVKLVHFAFVRFGFSFLFPAGALTGCLNCI